MATKASNIKPAVACAQGSISAYTVKTVEETLTEANLYTELRTGAAFIYYEKHTDGKQQKNGLPGRQGVEGHGEVQTVRPAPRPQAPKIYAKQYCDCSTTNQFHARQIQPH